jgi:site-specific recombinase XerD
MTAAGTIETRLTGNGVWKILKRRAAQAGLTVPEGERLSPHGMRAGFITEVIRHPGISIPQGGLGRCFSIAAATVLAV